MAEIILFAELDTVQITEPDAVPEESDTNTLLETRISQCAT